MVDAVLYYLSPIKGEPRTAEGTFRSIAEARQWARESTNHIDEATLEIWTAEDEWDPTIAEKYSYGHREEC